MDTRTILKADNGAKMQEKETLDERLPGLFEPDTLLPIQYFEAMRKKHLLEGEKRLILSVLEDAIECFMKCIDASTSKGQRLFRDADEWIAHEDKRWVFSFDNVCDMLDINPEYMRMGLRKWKEKRLDAIARQRAALALEAERAAAEAAMQPAAAAAAPRGGPRARGRGRNSQAGQSRGQTGARQAPPRARADRQALGAQTAQSARIRQQRSDDGRNRDRRHLATREAARVSSTRAPLLSCQSRPYLVAFYRNRQSWSAMPLRTKIECPSCEADVVVKRGGVCPNCGASITGHVARVRAREKRIEQVVAVVATVLVVGLVVVTSGATLLEGIAAYAIVGAVMYYLARRTFV